MGVSIYDQLAAITADSTPATGSDTSSGADTGANTETGVTAPETVEGSTDTTQTETPSGDGTGTSDKTVDATTTPTTQVEENPYDVEVDDQGEPPKLTLDGILQTPRGREIYQNHKVLMELAKPIGPDGTSGGIGHVPTVDQIKDYYAAYRDRVVMDGQLDSGSVKGAEAFIEFALGKNRGQAANTVAQSLASTLMNKNPDAYVAASLPFVGNYAAVLWDRFKAAPDVTGADGTVSWSPEKTDLYKTAQMIHRDLTGKWMGLDELGLAAPGPAKVDPLSEERKSLNEQQERIRQERVQNEQLTLNRWTNGVSSSIGTSLYAELDKALAPLKTMHAAAPKVYQSARKDFHDTVLQAVQGNTHTWDMYQIRVAEAQRLGTPEAAQVITQEFMKMAIPAIKANFREYLKQYGVVLKNTSAERHTQLSGIDSKRDVGGNGSTPVPAKGGALPPKLPSESSSDYNFRMLKS